MKWVSLIISGTVAIWLCVALSLNAAKVYEIDKFNKALPYHGTFCRHGYLYFSHDRSAAPVFENDKPKRCEEAK